MKDHQCSCGGQQLLEARLNERFAQAVPVIVCIRLNRPCFFCLVFVMRRRVGKVNFHGTFCSDRIHLFVYCNGTWLYLDIDNYLRMLSSLRCYCIWHRLNANYSDEFKSLFERIAYYLLIQSSLQIAKGLSSYKVIEAQGFIKNEFGYQCVGQYIPVAEKMLASIFRITHEATYTL